MLRLVAGFLAGLLASATCFAQEDAVLVEATRFPEDVRRLPASTSVITASEIASSAARTLPELLATQVGIQMRDLYGNNAAITTIDLRGFGATAAQNTLILLDGRRLNDIDLSGVQWAAIPLSAIDRIEVLRGAGAVLYGDGATSGVVNIVTRSPLQQGRRLEAFGRLASYGTQEGQVYASTATGSFGVNGSLYGYGSDGYRANNRNEQQNATLNLRWALGEGALDLRFGTDRQDIRLPGGRRIQPSAGLDELAADPRGARTPLDYASRDGRRAGANFMQRFGETEFSVGADYREKDQRSFFDQSGSPRYLKDELDLTSLTPKVRIPFATGTLTHSVVAGIDLHSWRFRSDRTNRPENIARPGNRVRVDQETEGLYVQDTVDITRTTIAHAGWRIERAKYAGDDVADAGSPACAFGCTAAPSVRRTLKQDAWELGLRQAFGSAWSVFGRIAKSFRFVNAEEIYENDASFSAQFQVLQPQTAHTREAGVEWKPGRNRLRVTLFQSDVSNEIHLDPFTSGVGNTNLPPSRREGVELDGAWQATPALRFGAAYAYTDARFREGTLAGGAFAIGTNMSIAGHRVPLVPRHKLNANVAWSIAPATELFGAITAVSNQVMDNDEPDTLGRRIPAYALVDARLSQKLGWGRLSLAVNNLLNKGYYTYAIRSAFTRDRFDVYPLPGRTIGVTAEITLQ